MKILLVFMALLSCPMGAVAECRHWDHAFVLMKNNRVDYITPPFDADLFRGLSIAIRQNYVSIGVDLYRLRDVDFCDSNQSDVSQPDAVAVLVNGVDTMAIKINYKEAHELIQMSSSSGSAVQDR